MADFKNRDEIKASLKTQPRDVCAIFAARAALRVVPIFSGLLNNKELQKFPTDIILPNLWATATALSAGNWPDRAVVLAAAYAATYAADAADAVADAAYTAAYAATYAADAADAAADAYAADAADAVAAAADADAAHIYHAFSKDRGFIDDNGGTARTLSEQPLWPNRDIPTPLNSQWKRLKDYLLNRKREDWDVWTDWYEDRLIGRPLIKEIEIGDPENGQYGRVTFPLKDYEDPAIINPKIRAMIADYWSRQEALTQGKPQDKNKTVLDIENIKTPTVYEIQGGTGILELKELKDVIDGLEPTENFKAGHSNKTPIDIPTNSFLTLKATVNSLIEFQSVPQWEHNVRSTMQSLIRVLKDFDTLLEKVGGTLGTAGKLLKSPLRAVLTKLQAVLEAMKPTDED